MHVTHVHPSVTLHSNLLALHIARYRVVLWGPSHVTMEKVRPHRTSLSMWWVHCRCDRLIIPYHASKCHWAVAVVDVKRRRLLCFDSLQWKHPKLMDALQKWIQDEAKVTEGTIHGLSWLGYFVLASPATPPPPAPSALQASARGWGPLSTAATRVRSSMLSGTV